MANNAIKTRIQNKHDSQANWEKALNFKPLVGELIVYDVDENYSYERFKLGDGINYVNDLPFADEALVETINELDSKLREVSSQQSDFSDLLTEHLLGVDTSNLATVDKITYLDDRGGGVSDIEVNGGGVCWHTDEIEIELNDGDDYCYARGGNKIPLVAGENVTFEVDEENQVVKVDLKDIITLKGNYPLALTKNTDQYKGYCYVNPPALKSGTIDLRIQPKSGTIALLSDINDVVYGSDESIIGTWVFHDEVNPNRLSTDEYRNLSFISNGYVYDTITKSSVGSSSWGINGIAYFNNDGEPLSNGTKYTSNPSGSYGIQHGWSDLSYKTIFVTEESKNENTIAWLRENADRLEGQNGLQPKADINLTTTAKTVVGAINELSGSISDLDAKTKGSVGLAIEANDTDKTCIIIGRGGCLDSEIIIPREINGYTVVEISTAAFEQDEIITKLVISSPIHAINSSAFMCCPLLQSVTINANTIHTHAFAYCDNLQEVALTSTLEIGGSAFLNCLALESIIIPKSTSLIDDDAFFGCPIKTIVLESPYSVLGTRVFSSNSENRHVYYVGSVEDWNEGAIRIGLDNEGLTSATIHCNFTNTFTGINEKLDSIYTDCQTKYEETLETLNELSDAVQGLQTSCVSTWKFNDTVYWPSTFIGRRFYFNFSATNGLGETIYFDSIYFSPQDGEVFSYFGDDDWDDVYSGSGWSTGGNIINIHSEPTDPEFISWLRKHATCSTLNELDKQVIINTVLSSIPYAEGAEF